MKFKKIIFFIVIISFSCSKKKENNLESADVRIDIATNEDVTFKELVDENYFIKLETTDESNLKYISDVQITKDYIFIGDIGAQGIFVFSFPEGKFVRKINALGVGPEEYLGFQDFQVDDNSKTIEILDSNQKKIIKYNFEGKYISSKNIPIIGAMEFFTLENGESIVSGILNEFKDDEKYQIFKMYGGLIGEKYFEVEKEFGFLSKSLHNLMVCNKSIFFNPLYSSKIYLLDGGKIKFKYFIDFGNNWMDNKVMYENTDPSSFDRAIDKNNFVKSLNPVVGDDFLTISYYFNKKKHFCLYNINTNKVYYINDFRDSILRGNGYYYYSNGYFISTKDPMEILETYKNGNIDSELISEEFISNLTIYDNPVLMFTKFIDKSSKTGEL